MLKLYNTLSRSKEEFKPINENNTGLYTCGPTVYNFAHIGNLRTYVFEDILKRVLLVNGYNVKHVMNITDVGHLTDDADEGEDKMLAGARREKKTVWDIAKFYENAFFADTEKLNILDPDIKCRATEHIDDMIKMIQKIEENGYTYKAGGNVYFDITKFEDYGKMALLDKSELKAGARITVDENKHNPHDFVLWFTKSKFENQTMQWDSPWGRGFPGWHIECSAMSVKYLGEHFDIHCGGIDHIPVHHTNEIAQTEAAAGKKWVNYWIHGEFLVMKDGKMSKSKGGFITLKTLEDEGYDPLVYRYFLLGAHYRAQLIFKWEALDAAANALTKLKDRIHELKDKAKEDKGLREDRIVKYWSKFLDSLNDDLNVPQGLALLWTVLKDSELTAAEKIELSGKFDEILGLKLLETEQGVLDSDIEELIEERIQARKDKNWARADEIRNKLDEMGIILRDTPEGTTWRKK